MYQLNASLAIKSTCYHNASLFFNYFKAVLEKYPRPINSPRNGVKNVTSALLKFLGLDYILLK